MSKLVWDEVGTRTFETGVDRGVLFPMKGGVYQKGVAWNGLTGVNEQPSGGEDNSIYADNIEYLNIKSAEKFGATIECYTYPDEWAQCDGSAELAKGVTIRQQTRSKFGFSYRSKIGNDTEGDDYGYTIHLVYGCSASPSEVNRQTVNETPEAISLSYSISTTPVLIEGFKPSAHLEINSTKCDPDKLAEFEKILYGDDDNESRLPLPNEVASLFDTDKLSVTNKGQTPVAKVSTTKS